MGARWFEDVERRARAALPEHVHRYVTAGAREERTLAEALDSWSRVRFRPRVLHDVREPQLGTTLLGRSFASPVGIAPTSLQRLAHPGGELGMARAAAATDTLMVVSSNAGTTFDDLAATGVTWWLQAYLTADRALVADTLERAAACGARAVALTVDTPVPGTKYDIADDAVFGDLSHAYGLNHPDAVRGQTAGAEHAQDLGPADLAWITSVTGLPVVVKGVMHPDDARRAVDAGARGVWVSNHGGRQLDRSVSTAEALPDVVAEVGEDAEVYVDGGLRSGLDVLAALALGADAVFCGRVPLLALAAGGEESVGSALVELRSELLEALRMAGCPTPADAPSTRSPTGQNRL